MNSSETACIDQGGTSSVWKQPGGVFLCRGCLTTLPARDSSPDPRYCQGCHDFLTDEFKASELKSTRSNRSIPAWVPSQSYGFVNDLAVQVGDRVQVIGYTDSWLTIDAVDGDNLSLQPIPKACNGDCCPEIASTNIHEVYAHQLGKEDIMTINTGREVSPLDNLTRCRETLAKVTADGADPRVVGLWKSKVVQAEKLCTEHKLVVTEPVPEKPKPKNAGMRSCCCGCGGVASAGRNFLPGHDARFNGYIRKLDSNRVKLEELPELVQEMVNSDHELVARARSHK